GHLVAGISHEINNPLAALLLNLRLLEEPIERLAREATTPEEGEEITISLEDSLAAAERIRAIVAEMRMFAQPERTRGESVRIEDLLEGPLALVANEVRFKAEIVRDFSETPKLVVDRMPLSQAFLSILLNAIHAIEANNVEGNWIRLATSVAVDGVVIEISNSGPVIPKSNLSKIFEPFFTTKPIGTAPALGLSLAYETIKRHGGHIEARADESAPMGFRIWLPFDTGLAATSIRAGNVELVFPPGKPARILVVDDDKLVRTGLRRVLERHHDVTLAANGERALELIVETPFDLVICDLIMPGMNGMELFAAVQRDAPHQAERFAFLTGGTSSVKAREFLAAVKNPRAFKPLLSDDLVRFVDRALKHVAESVFPEK
ncbi:MAG: response regulator, partial [Polyangiaceae bacterium]